MGGLIKPEYVWVTTGNAVWTNKAGAEALARRRAHISEFITRPVFRVENAPFKLINKEEFISKVPRSPYAYMYGGVIHGTVEGCTYGDISVLSTDTWGGISYSTTIGRPDDIPYSKRTLRAEHAAMAREESQDPTTALTSAIKMEEGSYSCLVIAAMIIGTEL
tara:strand:+ start:549 stop:1037 length:489 start_codon:yes stop_codon:yes gene_type:complete